MTMPMVAIQKCASAAFFECSGLSHSRGVSQ